MNRRSLTAARDWLRLRVVIYRFATDLMARDVVVDGSQMYADAPRVFAFADAMATKLPADQ